MDTWHPEIVSKSSILGVLKLRWYSWFTNYRKRVKNTEQEAEPVNQQKVYAEPK